MPPVGLVPFKKLLSPHRLTIRDIDLLIEHQANFAMIPLTLEQLLKNGEAM